VQFLLLTEFCSLPIFVLSSNHGNTLGVYWKPQTWIIKAYQYSRLWNILGSLLHFPSSVKNLASNVRSIFIAWVYQWKRATKDIHLNVHHFRLVWLLPHRIGSNNSILRTFGCLPNSPTSYFLRKQNKSMKILGVIWVSHGDRTL
jgi:hypothetical protein